MHYLIKKNKRIWTIGGLDDYRHIFNTFIYILYFTFLLLFNSLPPKKEKEVVKIYTYMFGGYNFLPPVPSPSSRLKITEILL